MGVYAIISSWNNFKYTIRLVMSSISFHCLPFHQLSIIQLYEIMVLRQEVFVVEQDCPYLDADGRDQRAWHLLGLDSNGTLMAYARLFRKDDHYEGFASITRVVNDKRVRGQGVGQLLLQEAIARIEGPLGGGGIKISAQSYLIKFYKQFGFEAVGSEYLEDGIPHIAMIRPAHSG